ncbi:MAG TPA: hypothetical protein VNG89_17930, partial [Vicinamibacterales bacterium]|nr:hypothetical protein [Vicinamibacterales bacterium]
MLAVASVGLRAQLPAPPNAASQFDITGFLQSATLDGVGSGMAQGGHLVVNGHTVTVPSTTIVIMPATALTWAELFATAPPPYTGIATGMAIDDGPTPPMGSYQVHVVGNKVGGVYIAGLITIAQDALNSGAGYINFIDYATGEIFVGGTTADRSTGARVAINDPVGRYGRVVSPDTRFTVDSENPTIRSVTGYPMCLPRVAPPTVDPQCPQSNRAGVAPAFFGTFTMNAYAVGSATGPLDPRFQAPFEIGDYVTFAGTLVHDGATPTAASVAVSPFNTYISAHTIVDNIAIYTSPGTDPAYVAIDVALMGTGGVTAAGLTEAAARTRFEGFSTDVTRNVHLFGIDVISPSGATGDRDWGRVGVDNGIVALGGAVAGRWRFRPPCTATVVGPNTKGCTPPASGTFVPATREVRAVIENTTGTQAARIVAANGLTTGQYHAPIAEYIFPEQIPGAPVPPANFETMPFLASGGYTSAGGFVASASLTGPFPPFDPGTVAVGALNPWPADAAPLPPPPVPPSVVITGPASVGSGETATFNGAGSSIPSPPPATATFLWTATKGTFVNASVPIVTYQAPAGLTAAETQTISLTVTDSATGLSSTNSVSVTLVPQLLPQVTLNPVGPLTVQTGTNVNLGAACTDLNTPPATPCRFVWTQTNAGAPGVPTVLSPNPSAPSNNGNISIRPVLALGQPAATVQLAVVATNTKGVASAPQPISITVTPIPDTVTVTGVVYRAGKQRLDVTATSSVVSPNVILVLQPYLT